MEKSELLDLLKKHFSSSELQDICLDLGVEYEDLAGTSRADKARELIIYLDRRERMAELVAICQRLRPQAFGSPLSGKESVRKSVKTSIERPPQVFCCYSHEDEMWLRKLETHLSLLKRQDLISLWHDRLITPGTDWARAIDMQLETASVVLLLVSADFLASDYCYGIEMKRALERQEAGEVCVIPILVRPVDWKGAPFAHLQALPTDGKPVTSWSNRDEAFLNITEGIRSVVQEYARGLD